MREAADSVYRELTDGGYEVLLDDRDERPGVMFADMELIGVPHRFVIGDRGLKDKVIEYQGRRDKESRRIPLDQALSALRAGS